MSVFLTFCCREQLIIPCFSENLPSFPEKCHAFCRREQLIREGSMKKMLVIYATVLLLICLPSFCNGRRTDLPSLQLNDDVLGLIVFKSDLNDPFSHLKSWNQEANTPCSWSYIKCNPINGRVSELALDGLGLSGKIGRGLQKLQGLKLLSLSYNNFNGTISPDLGFIPNLETLNLSHNTLSGLVPDSLLTSNSIKFLDLSGNSLSGPLTDHLFSNCSSLRYLSIAGNSVEGPLPDSLAKCTSLNNLNLSKNHLSGSPGFGSRIWLMTHLRSLDLSYNLFSGSVPDGISALHNLKELRLQGNGFSGLIPQDIGLCPHLKTLDLSHNLFTGTFPSSLQRLVSISYLGLSNNMISGDFPVWIGNVSSLVHLDMSRNRLTGTMPASIGSGLSSLNYLSLSNNMLSGDIPESLALCYQLKVIHLSSNLFSGAIPDGLFDLGFEEVDFSDNALAGSIPPGSSRLFESVRSFDLSRNNFRGTIPTEMGLFANLNYLNLSWNSLQSRIPPEFGWFQNLTVLDLRNNALFGSIPADICESGSLTILQLDGNSLEGPIPQDIGNCSSLYLLSLSHNNLSGPIPRSIANISKLKVLKLEFNELSGEIPQELGELETLVVVNISYNRLIGRLPTGGIFPSLDSSALQGNLGICSPLLNGPCKMNVPKPLVLDPYAYPNQMGGHKRPDGAENPLQTRHHMFLSVSAMVAISAAILISAGVVVITLVNVSFRRRNTFVDNALESMCSSSARSGSPPVGKLVLFDSSSRSSSLDWISNPETLITKAAEIGEGVFGTVYKASMGNQGRMVAIKKLITANIVQCPEDFDREVRVLGKARHPNLIQLRGYYWTPQLQLLVTDYAPNGSLQAMLHERLPSAPPLTWAARFKIIFGTAKALAHLHHSFQPPIIHYNVKPSNILLDDNNNPKISDSGLARLLTKLEKHVISNRFQSALGYVAPEMACQSLRVNEKCDVYGFGILMMELVSGRRPVEYGEDNVVILSDHIRVLVDEGNALDCVDVSMGEFLEEEVLPLLKLALVCTSHIPSSRPSMSEVVQILQVIKTPVSERMGIF